MLTSTGEEGVEELKGTTGDGSVCLPWGPGCVFPGSTVDPGVGIGFTGPGSPGTLVTCCPGPPGPIVVVFVP